MQLESYQDDLNFNRGLTADRGVIQQPSTDELPGHGKDRQGCPPLGPRPSTSRKSLFTVQYTRYRLRFDRRACLLV